MGPAGHSQPPARATDRAAYTAQLDGLTYLLESGSDRSGALDFQQSATDYATRGGATASLETLLASADKVEAGIPLSPEIDCALDHGSSLGGARSKAHVDADDRRLIAKFPAINDIRDVVRAEFVAMRLAAAIGLDVAPVELAAVQTRPVLLIERFDRVRLATGWGRRAMVSALTLFELDESMARYASYERLAEIVRHRFDGPRETPRELFGRLVFNILCGNTDDRARNHAAFWDGTRLTLTPAYDLCLQPRTGGEASQSMTIIGDRRDSRLIRCIEAAGVYQLDAATARAIIDAQVAIIHARFNPICDAAGSRRSSARSCAIGSSSTPTRSRGTAARSRPPPRRQK